MPIRFYLFFLAMIIFPVDSLAQDINSSFLVRGDERSKLIPHSVRLVFFDDNEEISVELRRKILNSDECSKISINVSASSYNASICLPEEIVNELDFATVSVSVYGARRNKDVLVEIKYGESSGCFVNDDGRSFVSASFYINGQRELYTTEYVDCDAVVTEIGL